MIRNGLQVLLLEFCQFLVVEPHMYYVDLDVGESIVDKVLPAGNVLVGTPFGNGREVSLLLG